VVHGGVQKIKEHPWFFGFDFTGLEQRRMRPPVIPYIGDNTDMHNFAWFDDDHTNKAAGKDNDDEKYEEDPESWDAEF